MRKRNTSRRPAASPAAEGLDAELAHIHGLGLDELRALWRSLARRKPPTVLSREMLARMVAYKFQEQRLGKLAISNPQAPGPAGPGRESASMSLKNTPPGPSGI